MPISTGVPLDVAYSAHWYTTTPVSSVSSQVRTSVYGPSALGKRSAALRMKAVCKLGEEANAAAARQAVKPKKNTKTKNKKENNNLSSETGTSTGFASRRR